MKRIFFYITFVMIVLAASCKKAPLLMYNDKNRVQLNDTTTVTESFVYDSASVVRDTVYIQVNTIGDVSSVDRDVQLTQVPEYSYALVTDSVTHLLDTVYTPVAYPAVAGIHFLPLNDHSLDSIRVIKANQVTAQIPIVLLRDTSLKTNSYRLRVSLASSRDFSLGEAYKREITIVFSDHLERFYDWRVDNGMAIAYSYFGKYSTGKHQFMIDVLNTTIDENWFTAANTAGALSEYRTLLKNALAAFNTDPANIASGKAPVRETSDPTSAAITFP